MILSNGEKMPALPVVEAKRAKPVGHENDVRFTFQSKDRKTSAVICCSPDALPAVPPDENVVKVMATLQEVQWAEHFSDATWKFASDRCNRGPEEHRLTPEAAKWWVSEMLSGGCGALASSTPNYTRSDWEHPDKHLFESSSPGRFLANWPVISRKYYRPQFVAPSIEDAKYVVNCSIPASVKRMKTTACTALKQNMATSFHEKNNDPDVALRTARSDVLFEGDTEMEDYPKGSFGCVYAGLCTDLLWKIMILKDLGADHTINEMLSGEWAAMDGGTGSARGMVRHALKIMPGVFGILEKEYPQLRNWAGMTEQEAADQKRADGLKTIEARRVIAAHKAASS